MLEKTRCNGFAPVSWTGEVLGSGILFDGILFSSLRVIFWFGREHLSIPACTFPRRRVERLSRAADTPAVQCARQSSSGATAQVGATQHALTAQ